MCRKLRWKKAEDNPYSRFKKPCCEECDFIAIDPCQLDVHHIDKNRKNNDPMNLKTLCANCHRLLHKDDHGKKHTYPSS